MRAEDAGLKQAAVNILPWETRIEDKSIFSHVSVSTYNELARVTTMFPWPINMMFISGVRLFVLFSKSIARVFQVGCVIRSTYAIFFVQQASAFCDETCGESGLRHYMVVFNSSRRNRSVLDLPKRQEWFTHTSCTAGSGRTPGIHFPRYTKRNTDPMKTFLYICHSHEQANSVAHVQNFLASFAVEPAMKMFFRQLRGLQVALKLEVQIPENFCSI